jgi:hypothetical protein
VEVRTETRKKRKKERISSHISFFSLQTLLFPFLLGGPADHFISAQAKELDAHLRTLTLEGPDTVQVRDVRRTEVRQIPEHPGKLLGRIDGQLKAQLDD